MFKKNYYFLLIEKIRLNFCTKGEKKNHFVEEVSTIRQPILFKIFQNRKNKNKSFVDVELIFIFEQYADLS